MDRGACCAIVQKVTKVSDMTEWLSIYIYTCIYMCIHVYIYTCIRMCVCVYIYIYVYMYIQIVGRESPLKEISEYITSLLKISQTLSCSQNGSKLLNWCSKYPPHAPVFLSWSVSPFHMHRLLSQSMVFPLHHGSLTGIAPQWIFLSWIYFFFLSAPIALWAWNSLPFSPTCCIVNSLGVGS